ncbi:hypothetical protein ACWCPH_13270, partial [Streptomyces zhihengii]
YGADFAGARPLLLLVAPLLPLAGVGLSYGRYAAGSGASDSPMWVIRRRRILLRAPERHRDGAGTPVRTGILGG